MLEFISNEITQDWLQNNVLSFWDFTQWNSSPVFGSECWTFPIECTLFLNVLEVLVDRCRDIAPQLQVCSELPSVSPTSVSSTHFIRVSGSPPLFVKRWTSLALWQAVSPTGERGGWGGREGERRREGRGIIHSLCAQSAVEITQGNETADRGGRQKGGGWALRNSVHTCTRINTHLEIQKLNLSSCNFLINALHVLALEKRRQILAELTLSWQSRCHYGFYLAQEWHKYRSLTQI